MPRPIRPRAVARRGLRLAVRAPWRHQRAEPDRGPRKETTNHYDLRLAPRAAATSKRAVSLIAILNLRASSASAARAYCPRRSRSEHCPLFAEPFLEGLAVMRITVPS